MYVYFSMACVRENGVGLAAALKTSSFAHPSIHTYMDPCFFQKRVYFSMYVSISSALAEETIHTWAHAVSKLKKVVEYSCMYFSSACMGEIPCMYVCMDTCFYVCMSVCRFDQFLRENEHTYIHPVYLACIGKISCMYVCVFSSACMGKIPCMYGWARVFM